MGSSNTNADRGRPEERSEPYVPLALGRQGAGKDLSARWTDATFGSLGHRPNPPLLQLLGIVVSTSAGLGLGLRPLVRQRVHSPKIGDVVTARCVTTSDLGLFTRPLEGR